MMTNVRRGAVALAFCSLGMMAACQSNSPDSTQSEMAAFEARKLSKTDDGSVAVPLPQPEIDAYTTSSMHDMNVVNDWMLQVEPIKASFMLGEPVVLRVTLENVSDKPLTITPFLQPEFAQTSYTVTRLDAEISMRYEPSAQLLALPVLHERTFQPGESVTEEVKLIASKAGWMFRWEGRYEIEVDFDGATSGVNHMGTHAAVIDVLAGSEANRAAAELTMNGETPLLLWWEQGDHLTEGLAQLEKLTQDYPNTIHSLYAHFVLGSNYAQSFFNGKTRRPAQPALAVPHLETVRARLVAPDAPVMSEGFRFSAFDKLASSYRALGRDADAHAALKDFVSLYGHDTTMSDSVAKVRALLDR